jgi:hypothetical protein
LIRMLSLISAAMLSMSAFAQTTPTAVVLPPDTEVQLRLAQTLSSASASVGDLVAFTVVDDIKQGTVIAIPHDAQATGHITEAQPKKWAGRGGKLTVMVDYVRLPDGRKLNLTAQRHDKAGGHTGAMTGAMVATGVLFFPAAPLFLMMHGKEMVLPQGTVVQSFTANDLPLEAQAK